MEELNNVNLNNYRIFYIVCQTMSFTRASEILSISQPAISFAMKKLEEELECKLFIRTSKEIKLTNDGELLSHYVKVAYRNLCLGMQKIQGIDEFNNIIIRIGVPTHIGTYFLSGIIEKYLQEYPGIKIKIVSRSTTEMVKMLECRELDIIVDSYPIISNNDEIKIVDLIEFENCFAGNYKYSELTKRNKVPLSELIKYPLLLPEKNTSTMILLQKKLDEYSLNFNPKIDVSTTEVMLEMVLRGFGIGYFTKMRFFDELKGEKLYEIPVDAELPKALIEIAYIEDSLSKASYQMIELIKREVNNFKIKRKKNIRLIYTQKCPYKCFFCHKEGINNIRETKLSNADIIYLFDTINKNINIDEIHITGGEPFSDNNIDDLAKKLNAKNAKIKITTNGYLIKNRNIFKYINKVNFSIHSFDKEKYEKLTNVSNSYDTVIKNIKLIHQEYPLLNMCINMTVIKGLNEKNSDIKKAINFSKSLNASLKLIEIFNNPDYYVSLDNYVSLIEKMGYSLKKKTFRKVIYEFEGHEIIFTKCTCDAAKNYKENICKTTNDLFITMDGLIDLCRFRDNNISIYDEIINRNEKGLLNKIDIACEKLGDGCLCQKK